MAERILAVGVSGLPNPIKCISWEEIDEIGFVNISDFNIVFIDFSYFIENNDKKDLIQFCLNQNKFFEVIKSGIDLFILGIADDFSFSQKEMTYYYSWLPDMVKIYTTAEDGEIIKCLNKSFSDYFSLLKNWYFYYDIKQDISDKNPYLYDLNLLAINNADKKLGFEIINFRRINIELFNQTRAAEAMGLKIGINYIVETYKGKLCILPSLKNNSGNGILSILKNIYNFSFSRQEPAWCDDIKTKKSSEIGNEIEKLFEDKQKIESLIAQKLNDAERIGFYKQLLWQVGAELEDVVHASLKLIGLLPSSPTIADDDGILNYKNEEYMLEIKSGLEHGASFTELSKLITRMESRKKLNKKDCKGIFILNHFANFPLKERGDPFPPNVRGTAKVNNVKLITTEQLFNIIKQALDGEISGADAQKQFFSL